MFNADSLSLPSFCSRWRAKLGQLAFMVSLPLIAATVCAQDFTEASGNAMRQKVKHVWPEEAWARAMMQRLSNSFPERPLGVHTYTFDMLRLANAKRGIEAPIKENEPAESMGCYGAGGRGCHEYYPGEIGDGWSFDDPQYLKESVAIQRQFDALEHTVSPDIPESEIRKVLRELEKKEKEIKRHAGKLVIEITLNHDEWAYYSHTEFRQVGTHRIREHLEQVNEKNVRCTPDCYVFLTACLATKPDLCLIAGLSKMSHHRFPLLSFF